MGKFGKFLCVVVCGFITSIVVAVILGTIQSATGYVLYGYSWWFVLPVGAAISGIVASIGYNWSAKGLNYRPTGALLTAMLGISIAIFFLIYWVDFKESNYATTYGNFLTHQLNNTSISIGFKHKDEDFDSPEIDIGAAGYFFALLQIVGFGAGGYAMYSTLKDEAFCDRCEIYMKEVGKQKRYFADATEINASTNEFLSRLKAGYAQDSVNFHAASGMEKERTTDQFSSSVEVKRCKTCSYGWLKLSAERRVEKEWKSISEPKITTYFN